MKEKMPIDALVKEKIFAPTEKWADVTKRLDSLEELGMVVNSSTILLPQTDQRRVQWVSIIRKILAIKRAVEEEGEMGEDPQPEVYKNLEEAEMEIKKFNN